MGVIGPVLVLGAGGFIGMNLCRRLSAAGIGFRGVGRPGGYAPPTATDWTAATIDRNTDFGSYLDGCSQAVYLLGSSTPAASEADVGADIERNLLPAIAFLEAARRSGLRQIVFLSSGGAIYGPDVATPTDEDAPTDPISSYGVVKLATEKYLSSYAHRGGPTALSLRVSNPFGPYQSAAKGQGVIAAFASRMLAGEPITLFGDGSVRRDFIFIDDVTEAILAALRHEREGGVFNIGSGASRSILDVVRDLEAVLGVKANIVFQPAREIDVPVSQLSIGRAKQVLGWQPHIGWQAGLAKTAAWLRGNESGNG
jgi:UDP-glucose 4-epimerase